MQSRDLIGYGNHPPSFKWPNGANLAVQFVLNYEEKEIGFMMIIPKDKLSDRESVEIYLNPATPSIAVDILEVLQDEHFTLEITLDWLRR